MKYLNVEVMNVEKSKRICIRVVDRIDPTEIWHLGCDLNLIRNSTNDQKSICLNENSLFNSNADITDPEGDFQNANVLLGI
jgi:hypothetical protein